MKSKSIQLENAMWNELEMLVDELRTSGFRVTQSELVRHLFLEGFATVRDKFSILLMKKGKDNVTSSRYGF